MHSKSGCKVHFIALYIHTFVPLCVLHSDPEQQQTSVDDGRVCGAAVGDRRRPAVETAAVEHPGLLHVQLNLIRAGLMSVNLREDQVCTDPSFN